MKFAKLIKYSGSFKNGIAAMDTRVVGELCEKFNIKSNKTYNPVKIPAIKSQYLYSLIIGFIDGDGCITKMHNRKDCSLRIKCHSSWLNVLNDFSIVLFGEPRAKINNKGYAEISVVNNILIKKIKEKVIKLKIPFLERKWNKIDLSYINRTERSLNNIYIVRKMLTEGYRNKDIAKFANITPGAVSLIIKRNNLKK